MNKIAVDKFAKNMKSPIQMLYTLKAIKYSSQVYYSDKKTHVGRFKYNLKNPIILLSIALICVPCFVLGVIDAMVYTYRKLWGLVDDGVLVEVKLTDKKEDHET